VSFFVSSVLNAIQQYNGLIVNQVLKSPTANTLTSASGSSLQLQTNGGTTAVTLDTSQNMGLGVTPSPWISTYKALEFGSGSIVHPGSATNFQMAMNGYVNSGGSWTYKANGFSSLYAQNAGAHAWFNAPSGTAGNAITFTQAMTLDASGNLSLGFTGGAARFEARGPMYVPAANFKALVSLNSTDAFGTNVGAGITLGGAYDTSLSTTFAQVAGIKENATANNYAGVLAFYTRPNGDTLQERARIDSSGNLLVGQTVQNGNVVGFSVSQNGVVRTAASASTNAASTWETYSTGASAYRFYVGFGGQIYATSTSIAGISDQRLKENIRDLDDGLSTVMALQPRKFDWKEGKGADTKNVRGFIAQEFEQVFPDLIDEWKDPAPEGEEPYKSVRADLIPVLVKAIQEQQAIIQQLQADVAALKGQA